MYLITKQQGGYQAIPIKTEDKWDFRKLLVGRREIRIILHVRIDLEDIIVIDHAPPIDCDQEELPY